MFVLIIIFLRLIVLAIISWILIHFFVVFGVFLAISFPLWWLLAPKQTHCMLCRIKKDGKQCFFCQQPVHKTEGYFPKNFRSAFLNGAVYFLFSLISLGLVYCESKVLFKLGFPSPQKTIYFSIPAKGQYRLGEIFPMKIEINGIKSAINAVQADFSFDPNKIEVIDISTKDSFANIFIQKEINNNTGQARLTGGLPNPGFFSDKGVFGTVYFRGKTPGLTKVDFLPSSLVLANDSRGTNIIKELASASYLIVPEKVSEEEQKQQQVLLGPGVLGEQTENKTQMIFYEEGKTLGLEIQKGPFMEKKEPVYVVFLNLLQKIDNLLLSIWDKIF